MLKIEAFCDASHSKVTKESVACSVVLSETTFHNIIVEKYNDVRSSDQSELLGILQTLKYVRTLDDVESVTIHCDNESVIKLYKNILHSKRLDPNMVCYEYWRELLELSEGIEVIPQFIPGHQTEHNCNKVCDVVSHSALKMVIV